MKNRKRLSLRSLFLLLLGTIWVLIGWGIWDAPSSPADNLIHTQVDESVRAIVWIGTGIFAIVAALVRKHKDLAVILLSVMPMIRVGSYTWAWIVSVIPGEPLGYASGWRFALTYLAMAIGVFLVAALPADSDPAEEAADE